MERTYLKRNANTDEQSRYSSGIYNYDSSEILFKEQHFDPKGKQRFKRFIWVEQYCLLILILLCTHLPTMLSAQETTDTTYLNLPPVELGLFLRYIDPDLHFEFCKPQFEPDQKERWDKYLFQDKRWSMFVLENSYYKLPDGRDFLTYASPKDALHYFCASDPIQYAFDFHLKPLTDWKKFDSYLFSDGMLFYHYSGDIPVPSSRPSKDFIWEIGGGVDYELKRDKFLFYESSGLFKNQTYKGSKNKAGMRIWF